MWKILNEKIFKTKRVQIWIMPEEQTRFIFDIAKHYVMMVFIFVFLVAVPPFANLFSHRNPEVHMGWLQGFLKLYTPSWPYLIVLLVMFVLYATMISHRIFGPIFKIKKYMGEVREQGVQYPLSFRDNDYYQGLPEVINGALEGSTEGSTPQNRKLLDQIQALAAKYPDDPDVNDLLLQIKQDAS